MSDAPTPPPKRVIPTPIKSPQPVSRGPVQGDTGRQQPLVRFYRRMRRERVYPLTVSFHGGAARRGDSGAKALTVRPLIPGAHVVPAETGLDPMGPSPQATFYVTPHAKGRLRDARVQFYQHGNLVQEIGLPMESVTRRRTWIWAILAVVLPLCLLYWTRYHPLTGPRYSGEHVVPDAHASPGEVLERMIRENIPTTPRYDITAKIAHGLGWLYETACNSVDLYPSFGLFLVLLFVTFLSWILHSSRRARRRGQAIVLTS
jgi:hypothetical protein